MSHVGQWFRAHRERTEDLAMHFLTNQVSQGWKGVDHSKKVIEVSECNIVHREASDGRECREKKWEARMKRKVVYYGIGGSQLRCSNGPDAVLFTMPNVERTKPGEPAMKGKGEEGEETCCGVQGVSDEYHFADIVA